MRRLQWTNIGIEKWKYRDADHFTSRIGIVIRRMIHPLVHFIICHTVDKPYRITMYPKLVKGQPYIFAAGHSFPGEAAANLAAIDRNAWILIGTTDQVDHNPQMYVAWVNGLIYVNRFDNKSRNDALRKMARIINNGSSVLMFPEGVLNNSENLYCMPLYPGIYHLANETGAQVVPIVAESEHLSERIWIAAGTPIDFSNMSKEQAIDKLRDELSTLRYELCEEYPPLKRGTLQGDIHIRHLQLRRDTYLEVPWIEPNWEEEIMIREQKDCPSPKSVFESLDKVKITKNNAWIMAPVLIRNEEYKKYDITRYMNECWDENSQLDTSLKRSTGNTGETTLGDKWNSNPKLHTRY